MRVASSKCGKRSCRQRLQCRPLDGLEVLAHLPSRRPVDARVGDRRLPVRQELVLSGEAREHAALQRVAREVADVALGLALVTWRARLRRQHHRAGVPAERLELRVELRVVPVGLEHRALGVVEHQRLRARRRTRRTRSPGSGSARRSFDGTRSPCSPSASGSARCGRTTCAGAGRRSQRRAPRDRSPAAPRRPARTPCAGTEAATPGQAGARTASPSGS